MAEMTLPQALAGLPPEIRDPALAGLAEADRSVLVRGISHDSRRVEPGDVFVAWPGERFDGRRYVSDAVERGAAAILAPRDDAPGSHQRVDVPWIAVDDPRRWMAPIAARIHGHPDRQLRTVGVTGTNGKTTVVCLLERFLTVAGWPCGRLGTLGYRFAEHDFGGERTTPEASDLFQLLEEMRSLGAQAVAMEVSSHALEQGRVGEMLYDVAVFTNLTRDHLDYHLTMEGYFAAKLRLFRQLKPCGSAVVGVDDAYGRRLAEHLTQGPVAGRAAGDGEQLVGWPNRVLTFGVEAGSQVAPLEVDLDLEGIRGILRTPRGRFSFRTSLIGRYNLLNILAAVAVGEALELDPEAMREALAGQGFVPGRLDPVLRAPEPGEVVRAQAPVLIDFAHTPAALEAALESMREIWPGRIAIVFGCGGEKDRGKRQLMGEAAGRLADLAIATSDNPRRESPMAILDAVVEGIERSGGRYEVLVDRREAIQRALSLAHQEADWAVLVAGKGHEREQVIGDRRMPFDDRQEVERELKELGRAHVDA